MDYNGRAKGCLTTDGDLYTGEFYNEEGVTWWTVETSDGLMYETSEEPIEYIDLRDISIVTFVTVYLPKA